MLQLSLSGMSPSIPNHELSHHFRIHQLDVPNRYSLSRPQLSQSFVAPVILQQCYFSIMHHMRPKVDIAWAGNATIGWVYQNVFTKRQ